MSQQPQSAQVYEDYSVAFLFRPFARDFVRRAAPRHGERVLDLACGTGVVARLAAPLVGESGSVTGLDLSQARLTVARERAASEGLTVAWQEGNAQSLPFPDAAFDLALCQQGLQFFPDAPAALREMHRVLAPRGRIVLSTWCELALNPAFAASDRSRRRHGLPGLRPLSRFTHAGELDALVAEAGFIDAEIARVALTIRYPVLRDYPRTIAFGALAAVSPATPQMAAEQEREMAAMLELYREGEALVVPYVTHVTTARRA